MSAENDVKESGGGQRTKSVSPSPRRDHNDRNEERPTHIPHPLQRSASRPPSASAIALPPPPPPLHFLSSSPHYFSKRGAATSKMKSSMRNMMKVVLVQVMYSTFSLTRTLKLVSSWRTTKIVVIHM